MLFFLQTVNPPIVKLGEKEKARKALKASSLWIFYWKKQDSFFFLLYNNVCFFLIHAGWSKWLHGTNWLAEITISHKSEKTSVESISAIYFVLQFLSLKDTLATGEFPALYLDPETDR